MSKSKKSLKGAKNGLANDFTEKDVNRVNVRFNNNCIVTLELNTSELTISGTVKGLETVYTIDGTLTPEV